MAHALRRKTRKLPWIQRRYSGTDALTAFPRMHQMAMAIQAVALVPTTSLAITKPLLFVLHQHYSISIAYRYKPSLKHFTNGLFSNRFRAATFTATDA